MADFKKVQQDELVEIRELRTRRGVPAREPLADVSGLCFSGGGIRSATFCLGVLQGLATYGMLRRFDYISSVSGGGYIASWLISWIKRTSFTEVEHGLRESPPEQSLHRISTADTYQEAAPINFLRAYSNYLTPRLGIFSADTWVAAAIYIRNLLLNQAILMSSLAAVLLLPRLAQHAFQAWVGAGLGAAWGTLTLGLCTLIFGLTFVDLNIADFSVREAVDEELHTKPKPEDLAAAEQSRVLWFAVLPLFLTAALGALSLAQFVHAKSTIVTASVSLWIGGGVAGYFVTRLTAQLLAWAWLRTRLPADPQARQEAWKKERSAAKAMLLWAPIAGALGGTLLHQVACIFCSWDCPGQTSRGSLLVAFGPPLIVVIILLNGVLHVGLMGIGFTAENQVWWARLLKFLLGSGFPDQKREWWARLAAWLLIWTLVWAFVFAVALFSPLGVLQLTAWGKTKIAVILGWAGSTLAGVLGGKSAKTSGNEKSGNQVLKAVIILGPYVFIVGTFVLLSYGIYAIADAWRVSALLALLLSLVGVAALLGWRVDVNEFSLQLFYRNRLVRCYLGASHPKRCAHPFTGFDPTDDTLLSDFCTDRDKKYAGPYPILNCALNISHGERLAWQERKAESFIFTPRYCGYDFREERDDGETATEPPRIKDLEGPHLSYRPTGCYAYPPPQPCPDSEGKIPPGGGPYLGTAVATSGAAVNPNMGYHIAAPVAFLLTVFNVRLGWWMGNPRRDGTWQRSTPKFGLFYLLCQLFGVTDDTSKYVNLSDGYHFENLGLYELVRRHCKYIVVCDVGADAGFTREDLGNAVRKCRSDFGVAIDLDASPLKPDKEGFSKQHFVTGAIHYPDGREGKILYIKSALTGKESQDILAYKVKNPAFPDQSTGDQWFDESQFESYRALGRVAVESVLRKLGDPEGLASKPTSELFEKIMP